METNSDNEPNMAGTIVDLDKKTVDLKMNTVDTFCMGWGIRLP
jgi:hypothetical protein